MTVDEYVQKVLTKLPSAAADAFDPQRMQQFVAARVTQYYGETNRTPVYPRTDGGKTLQEVKGNLFKAATVYKATGNVSAFQSRGQGVYAFVWGIDLDVVPYARIHEYGGQAGRNHAATIQARPYISPALKTVQEEDLDDVIAHMMRRILG